MAAFPASHSRSRGTLAALGLLFVAFAWGCSTGGTSSPGRFERKDAKGFVITQDVGVSSKTRADFERALRRLEAGDDEEAIVLLEQVAKDAPHVTAAHIDLGIAYERVGDLERAERSLLAAIASNPKHPVAHNELGIVYRRSGRFEEARQSYERALEIYPGFHFARLNLAILCDLYLSDLPCAIEQYERYQREVPGDRTAAMWIADLRNRAGR